MRIVCEIEDGADDLPNVRSFVVVILNAIDRYIPEPVTQFVGCQLDLFSAEGRVNDSKPGHPAEETGVTMTSPINECMEPNLGLNGSVVIAPYQRVFEVPRLQLRLPERHTARPFVRLGPRAFNFFLQRKALCIMRPRFVKLRIGPGSAVWTGNGPFSWSRIERLACPATLRAFPALDPRVRRRIISIAC